MTNQHCFDIKIRHDNDIIIGDKYVDEYGNADQHVNANEYAAAGEHVDGDGDGHKKISAGEYADADGHRQISAGGRVDAHRRGAVG